METNQAEKTVDIVEVFEMLYRHLPIILLCTLLAAAAGLAWGFLTAKPEASDPALDTVLDTTFDTASDTDSEDPYTATALFMVRRDPMPAMAGDAESDLQDAAASADSQDQVPAQLVNTYSYLTRSEVVLSRVIEELGLDISYGELLSLGSITTQVRDASPIYELVVTLPGEKLALDVCESIARIAPDTAMELAEAGEAEVILPAHLITAHAPEALEDPAVPAAPAVDEAEPEAAVEKTAWDTARLAKYTAFMAALGFCACIGVLYIRFMLDNKLYRGTDVEQYLDMHVLGIIPAYEGEKT